MALGWGVVPYGTGDWGSEGAIIPGAGSVALTGQAPQLKTEVFIQPDAGVVNGNRGSTNTYYGGRSWARRWGGCIYGCGPNAVRRQGFCPRGGYFNAYGAAGWAGINAYGSSQCFKYYGADSAGFDLCRPQARRTQHCLYPGRFRTSKHRGCACFRKFNGLGADSGSSNNSHAGCRVGCINRPDARAFFWNTSHPSGGKFDANGGCTRYIEWTGSHTSIRNIKSCRRSACFKQSYTRKGPASDYG
jgi:hypothetical protein